MCKCLPIFKKKKVKIDEELSYEELLVYGY